MLILFPSFIGTSRKFLISVDNTAHVEYPESRVCGQQAYIWHQDVFSKTFHPGKKNLILILDRGSSLSTLQLNVGRAIAYFLMESLNDQDYISLITLDLNATLARGHSRCNQKMERATSLIKKSLNSHLNKFNQFSAPHLDPLNGFHVAKHLIESVNNDGPIDLFFITTANSIKSPSRFIDFYEKLMEEYPKHEFFLHLYFMDTNIKSKKNEYNLNFFIDASEKLKTQGIVFETKVIDSTLLLGYNIGDCFKYHAKNSKDEKIISSPKVDDKNTKPEVILSMTKPIFHQNEIMAVIGMDVSYKYLFEDFVFFTQSEERYVAILDKDTRAVLYHPKIFDAYAVNLAAFPQGIHFHTLENEGALLTYEERIFNVLKDSIKLGANEIDPLMNGVRTKLKRYNWQHVDKFVVIVVTTEDFLINPLVTPAAMTLSMPKPNLSPVSCVYHRLDLLPSQLQSKLCRHFQVCSVQFLFLKANFITFIF